MPNHITNIMTVSGEAEAVKACLKSIASTEVDRGGERKIDFNKIIPSSPDLDIIADGLAGYLAVDNPFMSNTPVKLLCEALMAASDASIDNFCRAVRNLNKHGAPSWYEWNCKNWGTKWNAYSIGEIEDNTISFDTAWSMPEPIFCKLSTMYPDLAFEVKYADEDIGSNCGHVIFRNGQKEALDIGDPETFARRIKGLENELIEVAA